MNNALTVIEYILNKFVGFIFNDMKLNGSGSVTFGWVMIVLIVFSILIGSLVAVPRASQVYYHRKGSDK